MSQSVQILKRPQRLDRLRAEPLNDDLRRLVRSMATVLRRRYPNEDERRVVQSRIMRELAA